MKYRLSRHAEWELSRRQISRALLESVLANPEQRLQQPNGTEIRQSRIDFGDGKMRLLRAVVSLEKNPPLVVTVSNQQSRQVLEAGMKVTYNANVDVLSILLSDAPVEESDEDKPGVILDYDKNGNVVALEILDASKRMGNPMSVEYAVTR
jgi:uncharacterized protein YuzE